MKKNRICKADMKMRFAIFTPHRKPHVRSMKTVSSHYHKEICVMARVAATKRGILADEITWALSVWSCLVCDKTMGHQITATVFLSPTGGWHTLETEAGKLFQGRESVM